MLERDIERYGNEKLRQIGVISYKFTSPNRRSVPDRLCLAPMGLMFFIEYKAPGKTPTDSQFREHQKIENLGHKVYVINGKKGVDDLVLALTKTLKHKSLENNDTTNFQSISIPKGSNRFS
jgi:hypothetical protein